MESEQALIKEAHQRRRRRRLLAGGVFIAVVAVIAPVVGFLTQGGAAHYQTLPRATREKQLSPVRTASGVQPEQPGPLAVGSNGDLYIADHARNQILERLIDGRFRVLVGNGKAGFSGDGGPATNAEINDPEKCRRFPKLPRVDQRNSPGDCSVSGHRIYPLSLATPFRSPSVRARWERIR